MNDKQTEEDRKAEQDFVLSWLFQKVRNGIKDLFAKLKKRK